MTTYQIRHILPEDAQAYHAMAHQTSVYSGTLMEPYPALEPFRKRTEEVPNGGRRFVALADQEIVGFGSLHVHGRPRRRHVGGIGMSVHEDWQGKGVGSALMEAIVDYADNWLNLLRIELEVYTDNVAGIRLYEKFGFEIEGTLRKWAFRNGEFVDAYVMSRIR